MSDRLRFLCALPFLALFSLPVSGQAGQACQSIQLGHVNGVTHDYQVVVGELQTCRPFFGRCWYQSQTPRRYGMCVRSRHSGRPIQEWPFQWQLIEAEDCRGAGADRVLEIQLGDGNDLLTAMLDRYQEVSPVDGSIVPFLCETGTSARVAIAENVSGPLLRAFMGRGEDRFYGSDRDDEAYTNTREIRWLNVGNWRIPMVHTPGDNATDLLCGMGGDDYLVGDQNVSTPGPLREDFLVGGNGRDICFGDAPPSNLIALGQRPAYQPGEAQVDGHDRLNCAMQRQGRAGRTASAALCGHEFASPFNWRRYRFWPLPEGTHLID